MSQQDEVDGGADSDNVGISVSLNNMELLLLLEHPKFLMIMVLVMPSIRMGRITWVQRGSDIEGDQKIVFIFCISQ